MKVTQPSAALQPVIDELLGRHGRAHTLIQRRLTRPGGTDMAAANWDIGDLPQLAWPCAYPFTSNSTSDLTSESCAPSSH